MLLPIIIYIGLIVLVVYFAINTIQFFKEKTKNDKEQLRKLDELIKVISQQADKTLQSTKP